MHDMHPSWHGANRTPAHENAVYVHVHATCFACTPLLHIFSVNQGKAKFTSVHWYKATKETFNTAQSLLDEGPIRSDVANMRNLVQMSNRCVMKTIQTRSPNKEMFPAWMSSKLIAACTPTHKCPIAYYTRMYN